MKVALALTFTLCCLMLRPAFAHALLTRADPPSGSHISEPIDEVRLEFSQSIEPDLIKITIKKDDVDVTGQERPQLANGGKSVRIAVPNAGAGAYWIDWSVVSIDGHRTNGRYGFQLGSP
jgi:copper resistance protein C